MDQILDKNASRIFSIQLLPRPLQLPQLTVSKGGNLEQWFSWRAIIFSLGGKRVGGLGHDLLRGANTSALTLTMDVREL
ncbi:hypothetical protein scyTo_0015981 [Scyliorhinus torazame]|uniref:Uncharacterized protein n=1 Tax=Scyliorhinus torazame TaxID=75743 RepID=A0A401Q276_SCYTO|nr:hypothetical protein [Scyliorhinus torazame]